MASIAAQLALVNAFAATSSRRVTIFGIVAAWAGLKNAATPIKAAVRTYASHTRSAEVTSRKPSANPARTRSAPIMMALRLKRSATTPATGLSRNRDNVWASTTHSAPAPTPRKVQYQVVQRNSPEPIAGHADHEPRPQATIARILPQQCPVAYRLGRRRRPALQAHAFLLSRLPL